MPGGFDISYMEHPYNLQKTNRWLYVSNMCEDTQSHDDFVYVGRNKVSAVNGFYDYCHWH